MPENPSLLRRPPQPPYDPRLRLTPEGALDQLRDWLDRSTGSLYEGMGLPADVREWPGALAEGAQEFAARPADTVRLFLEGAKQGLYEQYAGAAQKLEQPGLLSRLRGYQQAIPLAGPLFERAGQQLEQGDVAGAVGTTAAAGLQAAPFVPPAMRASAAIRKAYAGSRFASERGAVPLGGTPPPPPAPPFFSALERAAQERLPSVSTPQQALGTLRNAPGVTAAEMEATGLRQLLEARQQPRTVWPQTGEKVVQPYAVALRPVSKDALARWLETKRTQVEEVEFSNKSALSNLEALERDTLSSAFQRDEALLPEQMRQLRELDIRSRAENNPPYHEWQLPGGENYRVLALTAPVKKQNMQIIERPHDGGFEIRGPRSAFPGTFNTRAEAEAALRHAPQVEAESTFTGQHEGLPNNTLAHMRLNDRFMLDPNGPSVQEGGTVAEGAAGTRGFKTLFGEEFQSDWMGKILEKRREVAEQRYSRPYERLTPAERLEVKTEADALLPKHPLTERWPELLMKRFLKKAVDEGYDRVAWTTGAQQAARYGLSKDVEWAVNLYDREQVNNANKLVKRWGGRTRTSNITAVLSRLSYAGPEYTTAQLWEAFLRRERLPASLDRQLERVHGWMLEDAASFGTAMEQVGSPALAKAMGGQMSNRKVIQEPVHALDLPPATRDAIRKRGFSLFEGAAGAAALREWMRQRREPQQEQQQEQQ